MHILICDDDLICAQRCKNQIIFISQSEGIDVSVDVVESGSELLFFLKTKYASVDLIYLDYNMPKLNGLEVAHTIREMNMHPEIIFYTVDDAHAIDGYDVDALHYLIKGRISDDRFRQVFINAAKRCEKKNSESLSLSCAGEYRNINIADILYFEVQKRIVTVYYMHGKKIETFEFYSSLSKMEELLYGKGMVRIHVSYLVAKRWIHRLKPQLVEMKDGSVLPVGRAYAGNIKQL